MTYAIDTSVIMAILLDEPGRDVAARRVSGAVLNSVNLAEIITKCIEMAVPPEVAKAYIRDSNIEVAPFDAELAVAAGDLFKVAKKGVLSLGDRACIATAIRLNATALTADRVWSTLDLPCPVELIR
ncbi:MAG: type II toxin-antitoxin system VapC family toxin [Rhizobiaceae bacterium]|nr:type II toxin-antitoxin system VapC family toxin [Rhizobiaceae bacterium]